MDELVTAGHVDAKWKKQSYKGMVTDSLVVFVVRDGNPKKIKGWNDLIRPGIEVITPNPFTSGGARWNIMAAYGAWRKPGKTDKQAQANLLKLWRNVAVQDTSARASLNTFNSGKGDVLLAYENEALFARTQGLNLQFVIPKQTILIENPIAVTKTSEEKEPANAFLRFLRTPAAQQVFADNGYRPVVKSVLEKNREEVPGAPGRVHHRPARPRRLDEGAEALLRSEERHHGALPARGRAAALAEHRRRPSARDAGLEGQGCYGPVPRLCDDLFGRHGRAAHRRARLQGDERGGAELLGRGLEPGGRRGAQDHARRRRLP